MSVAKEFMRGTVDPLTLLYALGEGLSTVALTTVSNHREDTHEVITLDPIPKHIARTVMWGHGIVPRDWAETHIVHHSLTDANMGPIIATADYLEWRSAHPEVTKPVIPDNLVYKNLDPAAELTLSDVLEIGAAARLPIADRYESPTEYTRSQGSALLNIVTPRYGYERKRRFAKQRGLGQPGGSEIMPASLRSLLPELRDPHSPALHEQGTWGILRDNVPLYRETAKYFVAEEAAGRDLGRDKHDERIYDKAGLGIAAFIGGNILLQVLVDGNFDRESIARAAGRGSAVTGAAVAMLVAGGNITNSFGHGGMNAIRSLGRRKPEPKADGSYTANTKALSLPTFDEVGGQENHHDNPGGIAYTDETGLKGFAEAPFGKMLSWFVKHRILMSPGTAFEGGSRRDMPTDAVLLLQQARARTIAAQNAAKLAV